MWLVLTHGQRHCFSWSSIVTSVRALTSIPSRKNKIRGPHIIYISYRATLACSIKLHLSEVGDHILRGWRLIMKGHSYYPWHEWKFIYRDTPHASFSKNNSAILLCALIIIFVGIPLKDKNDVSLKKSYEKNGWVTQHLEQTWTNCKPGMYISTAVIEQVANFTHSLLGFMMKLPIRNLDWRY